MNIGIIGCGNMGGGIARRLSKHHSLKLYDREEKFADELAKQTEGKACKTPVEAVKNSDIIILAVKPKDLKKVAVELHKKIKPSQLLISILAGTTTAMLKQAFIDVPLLRMMPNMAVVYGQGIVALVETDEISPDRKRELSSLFSELGTVCWFPEEIFDAVTSLTASGPAFAFVIIEAMIDAAIAMGFTAAQGKELVLQMLSGAITMVKESGKHPAELKWQVTSPAGTTIAGIEKLEDSKVRTGIMSAFLAALQKAKQLSA